MEPDIQQALDLIVADPQKNFPRFLFESDVLATVDILNRMVVLHPTTIAEKGGSGNGHSLAIQCLWCWQDLMESTYGLSPVVDELRQTDSVEVATACLKLLVHLLQLAPSPVSRIRIKRELNELQVDEIVPQMREKFEWDCELEKWISEWMSAGSSSATTSATVSLDVSSAAVANRTDADSGTFSGEEDEQAITIASSSVMVNSSNSSSIEQLSEVTNPLENDALNQLIACLHSTTYKPILEPLCQVLLDLLKEIGKQKLVSQSEAILQQFRDLLHAPTTNGNNNNNSNSGAPNVVARAPPPPPPSIKLILSSPKVVGPPPPPINGLMCRERSKDFLKGTNTSAASRDEVKVDIPNALKLKTVPAEGKKMRHLQWEDNINPFWFYNSIFTKDNAPLSERGLLQAKELHERFRDFRKDYVFSSPYCRAVQTASAILKGDKTKVFIEPGFLESSAVISEAITGFESVEDTERRFPGLIDASYKPVHADVSQEEEQWGNLGCKKRVFDTMSKILKMCKEGSNILIIGHKSSLAAVHIFFTRDRAIYPGQATVTKTKIPLNAIVQTVASGSGLKDGQTQLNNNIWQRMSHMNVMLLKERLDFSELDHNFCNNLAASGQSATASLNFNQLSNQTNHKPVVVSLISGKRNLSVNIFLKMYKDVDKLIENLNDGQSELVGLERLKMLLQLLPTDEEQNTLNHYTGDSNALGQAEKFLLQLIKIADFKLRIEAMTFREEFDALMTDIEPDLDTLIQACREVKSSSCLQRILFVLLHMGNYLNHGAVLGNAVGFKLNSLWKINDVRATKGNGRTLLHFVAQQVNNCWEELEKELAHIQDAAKLSFETLQSDLNGLQQRIQNLEKSSSKITVKDAFFQQFDSFSRSSKSRLSAATSLLKQIEEQRRELAIYFCENEKTFSMEECFKIFHAFVNRFKVASHENNQRAEFAARKSEEVKQQATEKSSNPIKEDSLSKLLLSSDPYTPTSKRPRHSISIPQQSLLQPAPISPRRSIVVLDQDRDRQLGIGTARRRSAHSVTRPSSAGLPAGDNAPSLFKSSIKEEIESEKSSQPNNHLESFMDKALESTQITRFPVRPTEPITTSSYSDNKTCKVPEKKHQESKVPAKELKDAAKLCKKTSILSIPISPEEPAKDHISSTKSSTEPCRTHPILRKTPQSPSSMQKGYGETVSRLGVTRKNSMLQGIRTAHNSSGVVVPSIAEKTTSNPVVQLKPSQLKAAQRGSPTTATCPVTPALWKCMPKNSSPTSPLGTKGVVFPSTVRKSSSLSGSRNNSVESATENPNKLVKKVSGNVAPLLRVATRNSQIKSKQEQMESLQRIQQKQNTSATAPRVAMNSPSPSRTKVVAEARKSAPLTASEKRQVMMTPSSSVSTSSRPALIKTGSTSSEQNKPKRWM